MLEVTSPVWAQQVAEEHTRLRGMLADLQEYLEEPRPGVTERGAHRWAASLAIQLVGLHDALFRHFRFEEEGGMMEEMSFHHPRVVGATERLVLDHEEILGDVRTITQETLAYSEGRTPADPALRRRIGELLAWLERHERQETDLIQRLEYRDSAAID